MLLHLGASLHTRRESLESAASSPRCPWLRSPQVHAHHRGQRAVLRAGALQHQPRPAARAPRIGRRRAAKLPRPTAKERDGRREELLRVGRRFSTGQCTTCSMYIRIAVISEKCTAPALCVCPALPRSIILGSGARCCAARAACAWRPSSRCRVRRDPEAFSTTEGDGSREGAPTCRFDQREQSV